MSWWWVHVSAADPFCDLSHILSVLPAGKHVGESERLQTSVDQIWLLRLGLVLLCRRGTIRKSQHYWNNFSSHHNWLNSEVYLFCCLGPLNGSVWQLPHKVSNYLLLVVLTSAPIKHPTTLSKFTAFSVQNSTKYITGQVVFRHVDAYVLHLLFKCHLFPDDSTIGDCVQTYFTVTIKLYHLIRNAKVVNISRCKWLGMNMNEECFLGPQCNCHRKWKNDI